MGQAQGEERRQLHRRLREDPGAEAQRNDVDGVICGHIHHAAIHDDLGLRYINCGDWVESCTAIAEHADGRFEIITWTQSLAPGDVVGEEEAEETAREPVREPA